jgi:uncharacterized protein YgiB involved in biofilm formation
MKRSHAIVLGATGVILAGAWLGSSGNQRVDTSQPPESEAQAQIYASVEECVAGRKPLFPQFGPDFKDKLTEDQLACESLFKDATAKHVTTAPKFGNQNECEAQYGASQCRPASFNGASVFVPAMVGFLVANHFLGKGQPQALLPPRQQGAVPCPPGVTPAQQPGCLMPRQQSSSSSSSGSSGSGWRSYSTSSGHTVSKNGAEKSSTVLAGATNEPSSRAALGAAPARAAASFSSFSNSSSSSASRGGFGSTGHATSSSS